MYNVSLNDSLQKVYLEDEKLLVMYYYERYWSSLVKII